MDKIKTFAALVVFVFLSASLSGCATEAQKERQYLDNYVQIMNSYSDKLNKLFQEGGEKGSQATSLYEKGQKKEAKKIFKEILELVDESLELNKEVHRQIKALEPPPAKMKKLHQLTLKSLDAWKKFIEKNRLYVQSYVKLDPDEKLQKETLRLSEEYKKADQAVQKEFARITQ